MQKVNVTKKLANCKKFWSPIVVGELNEQYVKLAKLKGEFVWHKHDYEDELFLVLRGRLLIKMREKDVTVDAGEFFIVPRGVEHKTVAETETHVLLFEPKTTLTTGSALHKKVKASK